MSKKLYDYTDDATKLASNISLIEARATDLTKDIHTTVCGTIMYTVKSGRTDLINRLCDALNEGIWKRGLNIFIKDFGPLDWVKSAGKGDEKKPAHWVLNADKRKAIEAKLDTHLVAMLAKPYWLHTEQKSDDFEGLSIAALLGRIIKQHERVTKDETKSKHESNDFRGLNEVKQLYAALTKGSTKPAPAAPAAVIEAVQAGALH